MILGYHVCFSAYGFWLPNDPRGSGSHFVGAEHLRPFGPATGLDERRRSVAGRPHDRQLRLAAKQALKYPPVRFSGVQAKAVGDSFGDYVLGNGVTVWACSVLPEHVHLVVARHRYDVESVVEQLKGAATRRLLKEDLHPFGHIRLRNGRPPKCWGRDGWNAFLDSPEEVRRRIRYVEDNPLKEGKRQQRWPFVVPYEG